MVRHYYKAEDDNQLTLQTGHFVEVLEKLDNGWWRGTIDDTEGWFPAEFVRKIDGNNSIFFSVPVLVYICTLSTYLGFKTFLL